MYIIGSMACFVGLVLLAWVYELYKDNWKLKGDVRSLEAVVEKFTAGYEMLQAQAEGTADFTEDQLCSVLDSINREAHVTLANVRGDVVPDAAGGQWDRYGAKMDS
jgi:hypothetical protein